MRVVTAHMLCTTPRDTVPCYALRFVSVLAADLSDLSDSTLTAAKTRNSMPCSEEPPSGDEWLRENRKRLQKILSNLPY
jgi:hypothetical protein